MVWRSEAALVAVPYQLLAEGLHHWLYQSLWNRSTWHALTVSSSTEFGPRTDVLGFSTPRNATQVCISSTHNPKNIRRYYQECCCLCRLQWPLLQLDSKFHDQGALSS